MLFSSIYFYSQKASDVLEKGIRINTNEQMIVKYNLDTKQLEYSLNISFNDATKPLNFRPLENDLLLLNQSDFINVYTYPANPLNYNFNETITYAEDQIDKDAATTLSSILAQLKSVTPVDTGKKIITKNSRSMFLSTGEVNTETIIKESDPCTKILNDAIDDLTKIIKALENDQKADMVKLFKKLQALDFLEQQKTLTVVTDIGKEFVTIKGHFTTISDDIATVQTALKDLKCEDQNKFNKVLLDLVVKDTKKAYNEQLKRFNNFYGAYEIVNKAANGYAAGGGVDGLSWCKPLPKVKTKRGEIGSLSVKLSESGLTLDADEEITAVTSKELAAKEVKFRRFQRFVPEVSAGVAYTFFKYKTYGTSTDTAGQQVVSEASEEEVKNINVTSMLNFTYYIENTNVNPFWQIGVGANSEIPTLLTGFGLRGVFGSNRICISGGIAMTWIKELQNLKLGDKVDGTTTIENDLKPTFSWPPKPYIGFQYNF
jgi:hypothetical protein